MNKEYLKFAGSIFTSLGFLGFVMYGSDFFNVIMNFEVMPILFFLSLSGYVYLRLSKFKWIKYLTFFSAVVLSYMLWKNFEWDFKRVVIIILCGLILLFYHNFFRKNIFLKPLTIASVWLLLLYFFLNKWDVVFYIQQWIFIFLLTLPFDIGSIERDKIPTIPKKYGIRKTIIFIRFLSILYLLLGIFLQENFFWTSLAVFLILNTLISFKFTYKHIFVFIFYDGIILGQYVLLWLIKKLG